MNSKGTLRAKPAVCLQESQWSNPSGTYEPACCAKKLALLSGAPFEEYVSEFENCSALWSRSSDIHPHIYDIAHFREQLPTGVMDVDSSYGCLAGVKSLTSTARFDPKAFSRRPPVIGAAYDAKGIAIMLNVR